MYTQDHNQVCICVCIYVYTVCMFVCVRADVDDKYKNIFACFSVYIYMMSKQIVFLETLNIFFILIAVSLSSTILPSPHLLI